MFTKVCKWTVTPLSGQLEPWLGWREVVAAPLSDRKMTTESLSKSESLRADITVATDSSSLLTMPTKPIYMFIMEIDLEL